MIGPGLLRRDDWHESVTCDRAGIDRGIRRMPLPSARQNHRAWGCPADRILRAPVAAPAVAELSKLRCAGHRISAVEIVGRRFFAEDTSMQNCLAVQLDLQPAPDGDADRRGETQSCQQGGGPTCCPREIAIRDRARCAATVPGARST